MSSIVATYIFAGWMISCDPAKILNERFGGQTTLTLTQMVDAMSLRDCMALGPHIAMRGMAGDKESFFCVVNDTDKVGYFSIVRMTATTWIELGENVKECGTPTS